MQTILNRDKYAIVINEKDNYLSLQFPFGYIHVSSFFLSDIVANSSSFNDGGISSHYFNDKITPSLWLTRLYNPDGSHYCSAVHYGSGVFNVPDFFAERLAMLFSGFKLTEEQIKEVN